MVASPDRALALLALFAMALLSGCVVETDDEEQPLLRVVAPDEVAMNEAAELWVEWENDGERTLVVNATNRCVEAQVWVRVDEMALELPKRGASDCLGSGETVRLGPGSSHTWGPFIWRPDTFRGPGGMTFTPGEEYSVVARLADAVTSWPVQNETVVRVVEALPELTIDVRPEREAFTAGETIAIQVWFNNTRSEPYVYTSSDGCNDIHVWVADLGGDDERVRLYPDMEPYACWQALAEFEIGPGEGLTTTVHWDGSQGGTGGAPYVSQGPYTLRAALDGDLSGPNGREDVFVAASPDEA